MYARRMNIECSSSGSTCRANTRAEMVGNGRGERTEGANKKSGLDQANDIPNQRGEVNRR